INEEEAAIVRRIFDDFSSGLSSIQIATRLNEDRIPGPRGGEWNASTIRGDPRKMVGILNNPLYRGKLVWKRREWRKNPDTENRERRYRLRDESEWISVDVPDLRIVDEHLWQAVRAEFKKRERGPSASSSPVAARRRIHLLSGLIKCAACGSNFTIAGKDYYRCAGARERGTCHNTLSIRRARIEQVALSVIRNQLLTEELTELFVAEFEAEVRRLAEDADREAANAYARLSEIDRQVQVLARNMLVSEASPALHRLLRELEQEKAQLETLAPSRPATAQILPHPTLLQRFRTKLDQLAEAL